MNKFLDSLIDSMTEEDCRNYFRIKNGEESRTNILPDKIKIWEYFSKWRYEWVAFNNQSIGEEEAKKMQEKYNYQVRFIYK